MAVYFRTYDDRIIEVNELETRHMSKLNLLQGGKRSGIGNDPENPITLTGIRADVLEKLLQWCRQYQGVRPENAEWYSRRRREKMPAWDKKFLKDLNERMITGLIMASSHLGVEGLLDSACKAVANFMKGKSPEELREACRIENDFTEKESALMKKVDSWKGPPPPRAPEGEEGNATTSEPTANPEVEEGNPNPEEGNPNPEEGNPDPEEGNPEDVIEI